MISEKAFVIESSRSHCPSSNNLDRLKVNPSDIPSTGSPDVIQSRGGLRWYSGKSPATLVIHRLFPAVEVVGSNPAPSNSVGPLPAPNSGALRCLLLPNFNFYPENSIFNLRTFIHLL